MTMHWADERYVRLYIRKNAEYLALSWQAKAVFAPLLREADRSGIIQVPEGPRRLRLVAGLIGFPLEVVEPGVAGLLEDGCIVELHIGYLWPHYIEANETPASPALRTAEWRARMRDFRRAAELGVDVTKRHDTPRQAPKAVPQQAFDLAQHVTKRHDPQRNVTDGDETSRAPGVMVTPYRAVHSSLRSLASNSRSPGVDGRQNGVAVASPRLIDGLKGAARPRETSTTGKSPAAKNSADHEPVAAWLERAGHRRAEIRRPPSSDATLTAKGRRVYEAFLPKLGAERLDDLHEAWLRHEPSKKFRGARDWFTRFFLTAACITEWDGKVPKRPPPSTPAQALWQAVLEDVRAQGKTYALEHLQRLEPRLTAEHLLLIAPDVHSRDWLDEHYHPLIAASVARLDSAIAVEIHVELSELLASDHH